MKNMILLLALCFVLVSWNDKVATDAPQRISVVNESVWEIKAIYISQTDKEEWQENLLKDETLSAGGGAIIAKVTCGTYDIKIVDMDDHVCIIKKTNLCDNKNIITITDNSIANCLNN
ncbi:MAG: hypothetical protein EAZ08_07240 [Cytophagales bacterium]|nr:MAG: hypothetical protein EAZ08_07240 [Cytophagales bacterium]